MKKGDRHLTAAVFHSVCTSSFGASPLFRVAAGVAMKSTTYRGEAFSLSVSVHLYSISGDGLQENFLAHLGFSWGR
jgi:hypothetical protein